MRYACFRIYAKGRFTTITNEIIWIVKHNLVRLSKQNFSHEPSALSSGFREKCNPGQSGVWELETPLAGLTGFKNAAMGFEGQQFHYPLSEREAVDTKRFCTGLFTGCGIS